MSRENPYEASEGSEAVTVCIDSWMNIAYLYSTPSPSTPWDSRSWNWLQSSLHSHSSASPPSGEKEPGSWGRRSSCSYSYNYYSSYSRRTAIGRSQDKRCEEETSSPSGCRCCCKAACSRPTHREESGRNTK